MNSSCNTCDLFHLCSCASPEHRHPLYDAHAYRKSSVAMQPKLGAPAWPSLSDTPYLFQPFSLTSFALALLITFRTNSCYARSALSFTTDSRPLSLLRGCPKHCDELKVLCQVVGGSHNMGQNCEPDPQPCPAGTRHQRCFSYVDHALIP